MARDQDGWRGVVARAADGAAATARRLRLRPLAALPAGLAALVAPTPDRFGALAGDLHACALYRRAADAARAAAALAPGDVELLVRLAERERRCGRYGAAADVLAAALALAPARADLQRRRDDMELMRRARQLGAEMAAFTRHADALRDAGRREEAARAYRKIVAAAPAHGVFLVQLGNMLLDGRDFAGAEDAFRRAAALAPGAAEPRLQLGRLHLVTGRRAAAIAAFEDAAAAAPWHDGAFRWLAGTTDPRHQESWYMRRDANGELARATALAEEAERLRARLAEIAAERPELEAETGLPVGLWALARDGFAHPAPLVPAPAGTVVTVVALAAAYGLGRLHRLTAAVAATEGTDWRLAIVGEDPDLAAAVARVAVAEPRIVWHAASADAAPAAAVRIAAEADGPVLLPAPGALPTPGALARLAHALASTAAPAAVADAEIDGAGGPVPLLRGLPDRFAAAERTVDPGSVMARPAALAAALADLGADAGPDALRLAVARAATLGPGLAHVAWPLFAEPRRPDPPAARADPPAAVPARPVAAPAERARIAVIVPSRDNPGDLGAFVASLRATAAAADALDLVVVDNGGVLAETRALLDELARSGVRVIAAPEPFNWSHLNNRAAAAADAPLLVFANDDMRMLTAGWDDVLRRLLARPEIGAVGVRMVYPDGTVQHAGFLAGWRGDGVIHDAVNEPGDAAGPDGRYLATRAVAAVTGAFLAVRRTDFEAVGGFDAVALPIAWSDVDLCFALRARGLAVVETPSIRLVHHESKSRGHEHESPERMARNAAERAVMAARWPEALARDPMANPWWVMDLVPFRLVRPPSAAALAAHLARSASAAPWRLSAAATPRPPRARA